MASLATIEQYEALYGTYSDHDTLQAWLDRGSRRLADELERYGIEQDEAKADTYADIVCAMVHRALPANAEAALPVGLTQFSMTAGPYSQSGTIPGGYGSLYLERTEKDQLGLTDTLATYHFRGL